MKKILAASSLIILFLCPNYGSAQTTPDLDSLVKKLQKKYNRILSLSLEFTQIYNSPSEGTRRETGHLLLKKPGKMRWDYKEPEYKTFVSNGRVMYEYVPSDKYATRTPVKESDDMRTPFMFLLGQGDLRGDFKSIEFSKEAPAKAGNLVLRLVPKKDQDIRELLIEVNPGTMQIWRLSFLDDEGARSDYLFTAIRENVPTNHDLFTFKPPPGVEVRDNDSN
ncbi:MAG: outer membrane lipoprotein chaperone LolA [Blastocatellia bacterium]|nr:outer membrane lipoprotein chaperone LolA [Blastocatellia bacterium]